MYVYGICLLFITVALTQNIHDQLVSGLCLCIEDNDVFARADPGSDNPIVGVLKKDNCFVSSGGILHRKGITWYEANTVGGKTFWIDGYHLRAENMTTCTNPHTTAAATSTISGGQTASTISGGQIASTKAPITTTDFDPFAGGLDFCFTDDGQTVDAWQTHVQNGVLCKCISGQLLCPTTSG